MDLKDRIIKNAAEQFLQFGIRNVTMDSISMELGISKRTVYENFKDKTSLVESCIDYIFDQHENKIQEVITNSDNVIEIFITFMREGMKVMNSINPVFYSDMRKFHYKIWLDTHSRKLEHSYSLIESLLRQGIEEKLFRDGLDVSIIARLFHEQSNLIIDEEIFPHDRYNILDIFQNLIINFMRGISTIAGIEMIDKLTGRN